MYTDQIVLSFVKSATECCVTQGLDGRSSRESKA